MGARVHKARIGSMASHGRSGSWCGHRGPTHWHWKGTTCEGCHNYREMMPAIRSAARKVAARLRASTVGSKDG